MKLALVMPVYNEEACIESVVESWIKELSNHFIINDFCLILVNDGSKDNTPLLLDKLATKHPCLHILHQANTGHGQAVVNGYQQALAMNAEWIFQTDSDQQHLPSDFNLLWQQRSKSRFILGLRQARADGWVRWSIARIVQIMNFILFWVWIPDANIPFRLMQGEFLKSLLSKLSFVPFIPNIFLSILAARQGEKLLSIGVAHLPRRTGQASIFRWKLLKVCWLCAQQLVRFRWAISISKK